MNIYLAAAYPRRAEMLMKAATLEALGHDVTSQWMHQDFGDGSVRATKERGAFAKMDLTDIDESDVVLVFTDKPSSTGGYHVEFGAALMMGKRCVVVGPRQNIFHCLDGVEHCATWDEAKALLTEADARVEATA